MRAIPKSLLSSALALALVGLAAPLAAQSAAASQAGDAARKPTEAAPAERPPAAVAMRRGSWNTLEDQPVTIDLGPPTTRPRVIVEPKRGTLLADRWPMVYVPFPDVSGTDSMVVNVADQDITVSVMVDPVNDAPRFQPGPSVSNPPDGPAGHVVPGWAREISPGPGSEGKTQAVWFETAVIDDPNGVVASLSLAGDGALEYKLTGRAGTARYAVTAHDDGGTANGGLSASTAKEVVVAVGVVADLAIKIVPTAFADALDQPRTYQLVVSNLSPSAVYGARVVDLLPNGVGEPTWRCQAHKGATCPQAALGLGAIDAEVDLPGESMVVFTVDGTLAIDGAQVHSAFVAPPPNVADPYLPNNEDVE